MMAARVAGRSQTLRAHRVAQFLVLDQLARAFHGREERCLVVTRRGLRLALADFDLLDPGIFTLVMGNEIRLAAVSQR